MKYFSPNYWFKLWLLSAPLFNDKTQGINAKSIDNKKIKDWASNSTNLQSINQDINQKSITNQLYSLLNQSNQNYLDLQNYENNLTLIENKDFYEKNEKRIKREDKPKKKLIKQNLVLFRNLPDEERYTTFFSFAGQIRTILEDLNDENLILRIRTGSDTPTNENGPLSTSGRSLEPIYNINPDNTNNDIFILPVLILYNNPPYIPSNSDYGAKNTNSIVNSFFNVESSRSSLQLVFRARDFYLQGFINVHDSPTSNREVRNYYYFSDSTIRNIDENTQNNNLGYGGNYDTIARDDNLISWENIYNSFNTLYTYSGNNPLSIQSDLTRVILATSESFRFSGIARKIDNLYTSSQNNQNLQWSYYIPLIKNWGDMTKHANSLMTDLIMFLYNNNFLNVPELLGIIRLFAVPNICKEKKRKNRSLNSDTNKNVCSIEPSLKNEVKITTIKILDKNKKGSELTPGHLKSGDIYVGTTNGAYLIRDIHGYTEIVKFDDLQNNSIKNIVIDKNSDAYALDNKNKLYHLYYLPGLGWFAESISLENNNKNINITNIKEITKNSDDNYLKAGDIYVGTTNGAYLINEKNEIKKMDNNKYYFIHHHDNSIQKVNYNPTDNTYCHSNGKKVTAVAGTTVAGAIAGSIVPGIGTLIGAAIGGLVSFSGSAIITEELCSKSKREINNKNQWKNDFSKSINNEQNLPIVNNTNFVKSNITSL